MVIEVSWHLIYDCKRSHLIYVMRGSVATNRTEVCGCQSFTKLRFIYRLPRLPIMVQQFFSVY